VVSGSGSRLVVVVVEIKLSELGRPNQERFLLNVNIKC